MFRVLALAVSAVMLYSSGLAQTKWAGSPARAPQVGIFITFEHDPSQSVIQAMEREVVAVFAGTGAQFSWLTPGEKETAETYDYLAVLRFVGGCQMEELSPLPSSSKKISLASTDITSGEVGSFGSVRCDEIKACISGVLEASCARDREVAFQRALGRVVAHELFHILGHTTKHTNAGVTKALQTPLELVKDTFHIDRQAISWLRQKLQPKKMSGGPVSARTETGPPV